jgi:NAD(P)-dependent dehydrogenase (short-subunit alcohol dehydrogenase family)
MTARLEGKTALITGGARGQGAAHGRRLAEEGARLVLGDVLEDAGEAHAHALRAAAHDVHFQRLDVTTPEDWNAAIDGGRDTLRPARHPRQQRRRRPRRTHRRRIRRRMAHHDGRQRDRRLLRHARRDPGTPPQQRRLDHQHRLHLRTVGAPGYVAYTASKGAVIAMTKVAALEHAQDRIRVNAICPGPVRTPMSKQEGDASVDLTPLRRRAEPEEISSAVAFLASDDAVYITGAELAVDGGYLAR